jgi:NAD+ kinase
MRILLVSRIDNREALAFCDEIRSILTIAGCSVIPERGTASVSGIGAIPLAGSDADVAIVVGGDGTILRTIQQMDRPVPVLGINWGGVGFLADLEPAEALAFIQTLPSGFSVEERMRIALYKDGECLGTALNEAMIVTTRPAKMLRIAIAIDGVVAEQFRADGLLISTPTGSTAYAMSAGGPIVDPHVQGFLLVPLAPYMLSSRPHLISSSRHLEVMLESDKTANLAIDGQKTFELGRSSIIEIRRSDKPALFVDVRRNFFEKVDKKLRKL